MSLFLDSLLCRLRAIVPAETAVSIVRFDARDLHFELLPRWIDEVSADVQGALVREREALRPEGAAGAPWLEGVPSGLFALRWPGGGPVWIHIELSDSPGQPPRAIAAIPTAAGRDDFEVLARGLRALYRRAAREDERVLTVGGSHERPRLGWDDVLLPNELGAQIRIAVETFVSGKERYARLGLPWRRGFLFTGPPGNGKTTLCKIVASASKLPFVQLESGDGVDDSDVSWAFARARELAPAVLCVEDVDSLFEKGVSLSGFLNAMDGFESNTGLLVLATTNYPEKLDPALLKRPSRFDRVFRVPDPDQATRRRYLGRLFPELPVEVLERIAERSGGFSMASLQEVKATAATIAFSEARDSITEDDAMGSLRLLRAQLRGVVLPGCGDRGIGFEPARA